MTAPWRISDIQLIGPFAIRVRFQDGLEGIVRFSPGFFRGVFSHLINPTEFEKVSLVNGAVTWPGNLDLAPDAMHQKIKIHKEYSIDD